MISRKNRLLALLLALLLLPLSACSDTTDNADGTANTASPTAATEETAETEEETVPVIADSLPEANMDGWAFRMTVFGNEERIAQTYVDELTGNVINDAVYNKILTVEERFNVDVQLSEQSGGADDVTLLKNSITAGDDSCELAQGHDISMANASLQAMFLNVYDIPHLDFEKPWWPAATTESMTVQGQMYMMFNNISYNNLAQTRVMFFNKTMMTDLNFDYPYESVYEGTWTLDRLLSLSEGAYIDSNGNGEQDDDDTYGFVSPPYFYAWMEPFDLEPYCKDENGSLYYDLNLEKMVTLTDYVYNLLFGPGGRKSDNADTIFKNGRSMFFYTPISNAILYSDSETIFGLLPMPKLDESQDQYYGGSTDRPIAVPITVQSPMENVGIVIEALNAEGYKQVYPAYFEVAMKTRYADQTDDAKMLDIIHDNVIISFTYLFGNYASAYNILFENLFNAATPTTDVASWAKTKEKPQRAYVEKNLGKFFNEHASTNP